MRENNYKPQMPDVMEAIFDAAYLIFDLVAAVLFFIFSKGNTLLLMIPKLVHICGASQWGFNFYFNSPFELEVLFIWSI